LQADLFDFADKTYSKDASDTRKLKFLYNHSGIACRYSVIPDYSEAGKDNTDRFFPIADGHAPVPIIEKRMEWFNRHAAPLSVETIEKCIKDIIPKNEITHLITVSCTGMSAPGLDLQVMEQMGLPETIVRTSVNFMGCYAAIHALKLAGAFCTADPNANAIVVCTELCTLHFQKEPSIDNITSSLLFGDGCAAVLVQGSQSKHRGINISRFFSAVSFKGKNEMAWELSSKGFLMTLSGYVPELIREDFRKLATQALAVSGFPLNDVTHWCIHPGGKKILECIASSLELGDQALELAYDVLKEYGNMSSPTILFVLKKLMTRFEQSPTPEKNLIFAAAFGPGLTMETFIASYD
jgi:predicted naringenin-chalcone synthase